MSRLLAVETSTERCSVAIRDGDAVFDKAVDASNQHAEVLLPLIEEVLAQAGLSLSQLDGIGYGQGPGAFTALRIGIACVQGLAYGVDIPVVPISSLAAIAQGQAAAVDRVLVVRDARLSQVYWACFERDQRGLMGAIGEERVTTPDQVTAPEGTQWWSAGDGWPRYGECLAKQVDVAGRCPGEDDYPRASVVASLAQIRLDQGRVLKAEQAVPRYLRDDVARRPSLSRARGRQSDRD